MNTIRFTHPLARAAVVAVFRVDDDIIEGESGEQTQQSAGRAEEVTK